MSTLNIPAIFRQAHSAAGELLIHDFKMTSDVVKSRVNLGMHMFSFLQTGKKQVHFSDSSVGVNDRQSLLTRSGNALWTELLDNEKVYFCKLFFFSGVHLSDFMQRHPADFALPHDNTTAAPFFIIENDAYTQAFVGSLATLLAMQPTGMQALTANKFEEIMLYLLSKYGTSFAQFLLSLAADDQQSSFQKTVQANALSNLSLEEIAFLCNMSLSTFKRHFVHTYGETPGKWLQHKRLSRAYELLQTGSKTPSEIYGAFGYNNLSNFSAAFKHKFKVNPTQVMVR